MNDRIYYIEPERLRFLRSWRLWLGVLVAVVALFLADRLSLLWSVQQPWAIILAVPVGHLLLGVSESLARLSVTQGVKVLWASLRLLYRPYGGQTLLFYGLLALSEEVLFRALPLSLLSGAWWQLVLLSLFFAAIHVIPTWRRAPLLRLLDLTLFGGVLCLIYLWLQELWPLVIIHWIRNASIAKVFIQKHRLDKIKELQAQEENQTG